MNASSGSGECPSVKVSRTSPMPDATSLRKGRKVTELGRVSQKAAETLAVCHAALAPVAFSAMAKSALGKGLGALISARPAFPPDVAPGERIHQVDLHSVGPSPMQPRKDFAGEALQDLVRPCRA